MVTQLTTLVCFVCLS